jgi:transposase
MSFIRKFKKNGKTYLAEVESKRVNGKVIQRYIRHVGKEADGKTILSSSISDAAVDQVKVYGPLLILNHIAKDIGLSDFLGDYSDEILSLVFAHCLDYKSVNYMPSWFERTDLNMLLDLEQLTEDRLLKALDSLEDQDPTVIQKNIFERVKAKYKLNEKGILYDVTNTYLYGKKCPFGKYGKDKEGAKGRPLVQIGLGVTQDEGVPVFHKVFHGNIHDSRTLADLITTIRGYKIRDGVLVFDRGISSKQNQLDIQGLNWKVLCGLPIDKGLKKLLKSLVAKGDFVEFKNRVRLKKKTVFYVKTCRHQIGRIKGKLVFCFNERRKQKNKESRYDEITYAQELLKQGKAIKPGMEKFFNSSGKLLMKHVREAEENDGYSAIFTTTALSKEQMVKFYFDKDLVEKAFQSLKGVVRLRPIRHWLYNRVIAHVFICYLSYLLLSLLNIKLKIIEMTPAEALKELDTLYKVYLRDPKKGFTVQRTVALNKKQEKILRTIDKNLLAQV